MIRQGYAHEYTYHLPYARQESYVEAYAQAAEKSVGLWSKSTCSGDTEQAAAPAQTAIPLGNAVSPVGNRCPPEAPIKGNITRTNERIYHEPGWASYNGTIPEACYATGGEAQAAGFRAPRGEQ